MTIKQLFSLTIGQRHAGLQKRNNFCPAHSKKEEKKMPTLNFLFWLAYKPKGITTLLLTILIPICLFSQPNIVKIDTVYYKTTEKKIQSITETIGNKKTITSFYQTGIKQSQETYIDNKLDGSVLRLYQNGEKQEESIYSKGVIVKRRKWYQSGILEKDEIYKLIMKDSLWQSVLDGKYLKNSVSGLPVTEGSYKNNKKDGKWTEYYENGNKKSVINFKDDAINGLATYWSKSGKIIGEYNYSTEIINGKPKEIKHGKQTRYFENGNIAEKSNYNMGKKDGLFEEWYENGNKKNETEFKNDLVNGKNKLWFQNGKVQQEMHFIMVFDSVKKYYKPIYNGKYEVYYDNGNLKTSGNYVAGKEEGVFTSFFENGQKSKEIIYNNGLITDKLTQWHKNGNISQVENYMIIKENDSTKSVLGGEYYRYYEDNTLVEKGSNKNGKKDGLWTQWYADGIKANETNYCNGLKCGNCILWNKDGTLKQEQSFNVVIENGTKKSVLDGEERIYNNKGIITRINYFNRKNYCSMSEEFYEDGTKKSTTYYLVKPDYHYRDYNKIITYFSNGQLESESFGSNSIAIGRTINYFINGSLKSITDYDGKGSGNKNGYDIQWSSDGELSSFRKYKNYKDFENIKDKSIAKSVYDKYINRPKYQGNTINGKKEGLWISWFESEYKQFEENYKSGNLDGLFIAYYPDGKKLFEIEMKDAVPNGKICTWNSTGYKYYEGSFLEGEKNGIWTKYYDNGIKLEEKEFEPGKINHISQKEWYENGNQKSEIYYKDGKENGHFKFWYENGNLNSESDRTDGQMNGMLKEFYANGNPKSEKTYIFNKEEGEETRWYENGKKERTLNYINGKKDGMFTRWWENGNLNTEGFYKDDESDSTWTYYSENGTFDRQKIYINGVFQNKPSGYDCECIDSTKGKISFVPLLNDLASLETVNKMCFNFHSPIGDFYNNLFYIGLQFNTGRDASFYTFDIVAYQQMYLQIPDENGIKLILNPCSNIGRTESRTNFSISIQHEQKESTSATLYPKYLSIEFNPNLLHQWDKKSSAPFYATPSEMKKEDDYGNEKDNNKNNFVPAVLLFKSESVYYNETDHLKINGIKEPCFTTAEIGNSGILLDFKNIILDLDAVKNPEAMEWALPKKYYEYYYDYEKPNYKNEGKTDKLLGKAKENFVGVFVPESQITLPRMLFHTSSGDPIIATGKNLMLSGQYIIGTIHINATLSDGLNYMIDAKDEKIVFNSVSIEKILQVKGFDKVKTEFDTKSSEFIIYFYYSPN